MLPVLSFAGEVKKMYGDFFVSHDLELKQGAPFRQWVRKKTTLNVSASFLHNQCGYFT